MATKKKKTKRVIDISKLCVGRDKLLFGSKRCTERKLKHSDLCRKHANLIHPNQLIEGVMYFDDDIYDGH